MGRSHMAKAPHSFDFYYNDWLGGTRHLDLVERACYLELLIYQWQNGYIPREPLQRMNVCGVIDIGTWERIWRHIEDKFECIGIDENTPHLANMKMHELREHSIERWKKYIENGKKGGRPKSKPTGSKRVSVRKPVGKEEGGRRKDTNKEEMTIPPTLEQVTEFCKQHKLTIDPSEFIDFYESKGWIVGKTKMKNWHAALRRAEKWERNGTKTKTTDKFWMEENQ